MSKHCMLDRFGKAAALLGRSVRFVAVCLPLLACQEIADGIPFSRTVLLPMASCAMEFEATAYCDDGITKSGVPVAPGIVAADPKVLPLGSLIRLETTEYHGIYQVLDIGGLVKGRIIDIYMPDLEEALTFGRRRVKIVVLRYGYPKPGQTALTD
jgi:3D (Asp-Asp-Asp) domain-containing protein